ncbi:hypothetical protein [Streptomyces sp. TLI_105]|uniref:hypothetical protein n=1 Tax=Streptomyces sp. TLI_105 TaxID=1881019 RepID=UPI00089D5F60|nr:hypothetical protein [Streptomyces sp. TLI_105]SEE21136.1 hypothetical protein SAMN05428939_7736 [Streptomyces sp. TLI_105]
MSQEERDARLGLTGLTGAEREARIRLLTERLERETAAAKAALGADRTGHRPPPDTAPVLGASENG